MDQIAVFVRPKGNFCDCQSSVGFGFFVSVRGIAVLFDVLVNVCSFSGWICFEFHLDG